MAYKPPMKKGAGYGPQGIAKIEVNPSNKDLLRFRLYYKKWVEGQTEPQKLVLPSAEGWARISRADCSDDCKDLIRSGKWWVSVNEELTKIYSIRPVEGLYEVKVEKFASPEGQPPTPKTTQGKFPYTYFTVILVIVGGEEKGMRIPYRLRYNFTDVYESVVDGEPLKQVVTYSKLGKNSIHTPILIDFMDITGAWTRGAMPYRDNILPNLEKRILEQGKVFKVILHEGQVKSIVGGSQDFDSDFAPDVEE